MVMASKDDVCDASSLTHFTPQCSDCQMRFFDATVLESNEQDTSKTLANSNHAGPFMIHSLGLLLIMG